MLSHERLCAMALELPATEPGTAWGQAVVKLAGKSLFFWSPKWNAPVFGMDFDTRDFLIEADPETFFTTDHHRRHPCVLARPEGLDEDWARAQLRRSWRAHAPKTLARQHPDLLGD